MLQVAFHGQRSCGENLSEEEPTVSEIFSDAALAKQEKNIEKSGPSPLTTLLFVAGANTNKIFNYLTLEYSLPDQILKRRPQSIAVHLQAGPFDKVKTLLENLVGELLSLFCGMMW